MTAFVLTMTIIYFLMPEEYLALIKKYRDLQEVTLGNVLKYIVILKNLKFCSAVRIINAWKSAA